MAELELYYAPRWLDFGRAVGTVAAMIASGCRDGGSEVGSISESPWVSRLLRVVAAEGERGEQAILH